MVAVFISNCGAVDRLNYLQALIDNGVTVHSFGSCMNNKNFDSLKNLPTEKFSKKQSAAARYKFTFSFENSRTEDYVTEKLFGPLVAGSVPIYQGAPNAKKFAPTNHSAIFSDDFDSPKSLAKYLLMLDKNDELYQQYLQWKTLGPSPDWISLIDLSIVHSECRFCIRTADLHRKEIGEVVTGPFVEQNKVEMEKYRDKLALMLKVRERGTFYLKRIHLEELSIKELFKKISEKFDSSKLPIHSIYDLWDRSRTPITTDIEVENLEEGQELEIIFQDFENPNRGSYSIWYAEKKKEDLKNNFDNFKKDFNLQ